MPKENNESLSHRSRDSGTVKQMNWPIMNTAGPVRSQAQRGFSAWAVVPRTDREPYSARRESK